jgi:cell division septum initiation protein DivIVA
MTDIGEDRSVEQAVQQPTDEVEALRRENEELKRQLEEMRQTLKTTQDELATLKQNPGAQSGENPSS